MLQEPNRQPEPRKEDDGAKLDGANLPARPVQPRSSHAAQLKDQLPFICDLLFTEEEPRTAVQLMDALQRIEPDPRAYGPLLATLLNHPVTEIRIRSAQAMAKLPDQEVDALPTLFAAMQRERNEEARTAIKEAMRGKPLDELSRLGRFYEELRWSTYAKKSDLRDYSNGSGLRPDQIHRAMVMLHLDSDVEARQLAAATLYQAVPIMDPRQRAGLVLSLSHALSDPAAKDTYTTTNLLYACERLGVAAAPLAPLLRKLFDHKDGTIATGAALAVLWLKPSDLPASELLHAAIGDKRSTDVTIDPPVPVESQVEPLDFKPFYEFIEEVAGPGADTSELEALEMSMYDAIDKIEEVYDRHMKELADRMRKASRELSDWSRELLMIKIANRIDRMDPAIASELLTAILDVMGDPSESVRVRKAVPAYSAFNRTGNSEMAERFMEVACDFRSPHEVRARACKSLVHLEFLSPAELDKVSATLDGLAKHEPDPLVQGAAELSLRHLKFFRENPAARYSFLFDKDGNLHPAVKARLRDMISPD